MQCFPSKLRYSSVFMQCCGEEKWGDWRPHLAMVLSNLTHTLDLDTRTITTMGDTLGRIALKRQSLTALDSNRFLLFTKTNIPSHSVCLLSCCVVAASKGLIDAAHFCYLMAQVGLGVYTKKSTKMVLIGSNHRLETQIGIRSRPRRPF